MSLYEVAERIAVATEQPVIDVVALMNIPEYADEIRRWYPVNEE